MKRPKQQATPIKHKWGPGLALTVRKLPRSRIIYKSFEPPPSNDHSVDNEIDEYLSSPNQLCLPLKHVTLYELSREIRKLKEGKCPGYDLVDATLLKQLPKRQWRIKANTDKSVQVTFTLRRKTCPPVKLCNVEIPQADDAKYLGMHLDRRLTWRKHIWTKRKQLDCKLRGMYWLIGRKSQLSDASKMTIYKTILKPVWTYGIQLWALPVTVI
ncbi:Probable RNA-directed DNA polymerase from transposon X-element [Eumeta japonica]|uniref:Probable RNA-directed DNA polymerase from transposon X-element n=1 Tax=Eumeta variegata TaxID=151549 RepID=A0A4C1VCC2_EUMVA|nr:Probable RNA-directed DNA polymerase from transposon X-element [Eumeta japonica]